MTTRNFLVIFLILTGVDLIAPLLKTEAKWATEQLHQDLFTNRMNVRPAKENDTVTVDVDFMIKQLLSLDGKNQVLKTTGLLSMIWFDESMIWNTSDYKGVTYTETNANKVWTPLIGLRNSADEPFDPNWRNVYPLFIANNGWISWIIEGKFQSSCSLDMLAFPFDTQYCSLDFGNLVHLDISVNLTSSFDEIDQELFLPSKEFDIVKTWVQPVFYHHSTMGGYSLPGLKFWLELERRPAYYLINVIVPTIALAFLSTFSFLVPVDAGEKLSLAITILLSFIVFLLILSDNTPRTSGPLPILAVYLTTVISLSSISLVIQIIILRVYHHYPGTPLPGWMRSLTRALWSGCRGRRSPRNIRPENRWGTTVVDGKSPSSESKADQEDNGQTEGNINEENSSPYRECGKHRDDWRLAAESLDKFFFVLFMCMHIALMVMPWAYVW